MTRAFLGLSAATVLVALLACKSLKRISESTADQNAVASASPSAVTAALGSAPVGVPRDDWVLYSPSDGKFRLKLPQQPKLERHNTQTQAGPIELSLFTATGGSGVAYQVGFSDFPDPRLGGQSPDQLLLDAQQGAVRNVGGRLLFQRRLEVLGHPAREYSLEVLKQGMTLRYSARIVLVAARLYQLQVIGLADRVKDADRARFFDSFELVGQDP